MNAYPAQSADLPQHGPKVTTRTLYERKQRSVPLTAITAYDFATARLCDEAGIDLILVGDSLGMVVLGYDNTLAVTLDEMLHHAKAVRRGVSRAFLIVDMPFGSYHVSAEDALRNAVRVMKEAGAEAVKIEGGRERAALVKALTEIGVPVVGHIGLTPQSVHAMGGYRVQGRTPEEFAALKEDALALEDAGAVAVVLEGMPRELAAEITHLLHIPTIGIGAGPECDGQILVFHDMFGLVAGKTPKFVREFGDISQLVRSGLESYRQAVVDRSFPADGESYHLPAALLEGVGA